jgi:transcriptional regulator with XRE-family HTH domain
MSDYAPMLALLGRLRQLREQKGLSPEEVDEKLILGPGWTRRFESGDVVPGLDMFLALTRALNLNPRDLFSEAIGEGSPLEAARAISGEQHGKDLRIQFRYGNFDAVYRLPDARLTDFEAVVKVLRDGLSQLNRSEVGEQQATKTAAVVSSFLRATQLWPHANPSDLWGFLISRAYCDPLNHPAAFARLDLGQSWKRTAGWALEEVLVKHYSQFLAQHHIKVQIVRGLRKRELLSQITVPDRLEASKVDLILTGDKNGQELCFGVVHVKASFAERRTDDVPLSQSLIRAGYTSPLWTLDCKSMPASAPTNKGELGQPRTSPVDRRSAKRKDIEDDGFFSACFSYNTNTLPTPLTQDARARIFVCDFRSPDDYFGRFLVEEWKRFSQKA